MPKLGFIKNPKSDLLKIVKNSDRLSFNKQFGMLKTLDNALFNIR